MTKLLLGVAIGYIFRDSIDDLLAAISSSPEPPDNTNVTETH